MTENSYVFLTIGKTKESTETTEFKRYIGVGTSGVLTFNPKKEELEKIYGREIANEPEYIVGTDEDKEIRIHFIVKTIPEDNNGVEIISKLMFTLRNSPAYNRDKTKVQVLDLFGNYSWANIEDAKAGKKLYSSSGKEIRMEKYRIAYVGEVDLTIFLRTYLRVENAYNYVNGAWILKPTAEVDSVFALDMKELVKGNFKDIKDALAIWPKNKVKLLYGVKINPDDNKQYQVVSSKADFILGNNAGSKAYKKLEKDLADYKNAGGAPTTEFKVQELAEYVVETTNLSTPADAFGASNDDDLPWT